MFPNKKQNTIKPQHVIWVILTSRDWLHYFFWHFDVCIKSNSLKAAIKLPLAILKVNFVIVACYNFPNFPYFQIFSQFWGFICELYMFYYIILLHRSLCMPYYGEKVNFYQQFSNYFAKQTNLQEIFCTQTSWT